MKHRVYTIHIFLIKQYFAETLKVFHLKWRVFLAWTKLKKRYPHSKKSHFFYDINQNTEPLSFNVFCLFEDVTGYRDIRRINLKSFVSIGLIVFATQQHKTNTFGRLIIEILALSLQIHREFALPCTLYHQRHDIVIFSDYSLSPDATVLLWELEKQKYNATKSII